MQKNLNKQIAYSIVLYLILVISYPFIVQFIHYVLIDILGWSLRFGETHRAPYLFIMSSLRFILSVIAIVLFGYIIRINGFKYSFRTKGFKKALTAMIPIFLITMHHITLFFNISEFNMQYAHYIPYILLFEFATGIWEEVVFRAIPLTVLLYYGGNSAKGRMFLALLSSLIFGFLHYPAGPDAILFASFMGISFAAVYIYSKNLLGCMIHHALWNIGSQITHGLTTNVYNETLNSALHFSINIIWAILMPIFAIILIVKSKPFSEKTLNLDDLDAENVIPKY